MTSTDTLTDILARWESGGGSLDLSGCKNPDPSQWWRGGGETTKRRCIVVCKADGYPLIQTDRDTFSAGCRTDFSRERALKHWGPPRDDARARQFSAAIEAHVLKPQTRG